MLTKIRAFSKNSLTPTNRMRYALTMVVAASMMIIAPTFCAPNMRTIFNSFMEIIYDIALYCGAAITIMGMFNWVMANKDENADGQSRAIKFCIVGVALVCFKALVGPIVTAIFS